jgi:gamma-tubulin complex component 5
MLHAIIGPSSTKLHTDFEYATDMSSLINAHADFITSLNRGCLLLDELEAVRRAVLSLADLAVSYADMFERWSNTIAGKSAQEGQSDTQDSDSDSDTGQDEDADGQDATKLQIRPLSDADFTIRLEHMHTQHDQLLGYIIAGLRTAARGVEGESSWTILAEVLSWSPANG